MEFEGADIVTLDYFKIFDINGDGHISTAEFFDDMATVRMALDLDVDDDVNSFFDSIDANRDGNIDLEEFEKSW